MPLINPGLLAVQGLAEGIKGGLQSYREQKQIQEQNKLKNATLGLLAQRTGYDYDPQSGDVTPGRVAGAQQDFQVSEYGMEKQKAELDQKNLAESMDPQSDLSKSSVPAYRAYVDALSKTQFGEKHPEVFSAMQEAYNNPKLNHYMAQTLMKETKPLADLELGEGRNSAITNRVGLSAGRLEETKNVNASKAGQAFENDQLLRKGKATWNSLDRAERMLKGDVPVTGKSFNIAMNDMINAFTQDNRATEGKINRENVTTLQNLWNDAKLKLGSVDDVRQAEPQVVNNILGLISQVKGDYQDVIGDQARSIHSSFSESSNPKVQATIKKKLEHYAPDAFQEQYGTAPKAAPYGGKKPKGLLPQDEHMQAVEWAKSHPGDPRAAQILKLNGVQ